jgi:anti-sigma factor RsiW
MSIGERPIGDDDLQALIDGRLAPEHERAVEAYLAAQPAVAAQVETDRAARAALRQRLAFKAEEPIPARLRVGNIRAERRRVAGRRFGAVAAAVAWLLVGAGAGWFGNTYLSRERSPGSASATQAAMTAYRTFVVETVHPVEVRADQEAHLVQWLSRRLGKPVSAPDLGTQGFRLIGGRLLPAGTEPAAMFMYEDGRGTRLTLYTRPGGSDAQAAFRFEAQGDVSAFSWIDGGLSYVVTARTDRERLLGVAELIENQLRRDQPARKESL